MRAQFAVVVLVVAAAPLTAATLYRQTTPRTPAAAGQAAPAPQAPPTNLQVLSKDLPLPALMSVMQTMTQSLGVQCNYCHVAEGPGGRNDMASDEKATKKTARVMIRMVLSINDTLNTELGKSPAGPLRVQCVMCHRGQTTPKAEMAPAR